MQSYRIVFREMIWKENLFFFFLIFKVYESMLGLSRLFFESTENNSYIYYSLESLGLEFSDDQDKFEYEYCELYKEQI